MDAQIIINLTPHTVRVALTSNHSGKLVSFPPEGGKAARVAVKSLEADTLRISGIHGEIPVVENRYGKIGGLPEPSKDTIYIVSSLVLSALEPGERHDVFAPDTGPESAIRDSNGNIVAIRRFVRK